MFSKPKTMLAALAAGTALAVAIPVAQAKYGGLDDSIVELRHGADDPAQKQDDRGVRGREAEARHGADDPAGDDRGGEAEARHGADDAAGDDHGGGRGRGGDDGANHD